MQESAGESVITNLPVALPPAHPYLIKPLLFIGGILEKVSNQELVEGLIECLRLRPTIVRTGDDNATATGTLEFETLFKAEKAFATVATIYPQYNCTLSLHLAESLDIDPLPTAIPRLVTQLPLDTTSGQLFELCRPFGPIYRATVSKGSGSGQVTFYEESHAQNAASELHCFEYNSSTLTIKKLRAQTPAFVPTSPSSSQVSSSFNPIAPSWSPSTKNLNLSPSITPWSSQMTKTTSRSSFSPDPLAASYSAPLLQRSVSTSTSSSHTSIDHCNLFLKFLDSNLTSKDLYVLFEPFGKIVSARVMSDEKTGISKSYGFVSFQDPLDAQKALEEMNGKKLGLSQKKVVIRLHEPKAHKEEKSKEMIRSGSVPSTESKFDGVLSALGALRTSAKEVVVIPSTPEPKAKSVVTAAEVVTKVASPAISQHDRLLSAVLKIDPIRAEEIVEMMEGLPRKEIALCLFNPDYLRTKVSDALLVLSSSNEEDEADHAVILRHSNSPSPKSSSTLPTPDSTPRKLSVELPITSPSPPFTLPSTISELGKLPAVKIISLITERKLPGVLGIERATKEEELESDEFMNSLAGKAQNEVKQKLGDRLFRAIKTMGIKGAPKITITLLDSEELRPLAQLINYPDILREKVLSHVPIPIASFS